MNYIYNNKDLISLIEHLKQVVINNDKKQHHVIKEEQKSIEKEAVKKPNKEKCIRLFGERITTDEPYFPEFNKNNIDTWKAIYHKCRCYELYEQELINLRKKLHELYVNAEKMMIDNNACKAKLKKIQAILEDEE